MRNYFTITISDVHGSRHYSFKHFVKRFVWAIVFILLLIWVVGGISLWWLSTQAEKLEQQNKASIASHNEALSKAQTDYQGLVEDRDRIEKALSQKSAQVEYLDQSLQGLEDLVGVDADQPEKLPYDERVKKVQLSGLGKTMMMTKIPSGHAVAEYKGITSKYGYRKHPITKKRHLHGGIDYRSKAGDAVVATADGVVSFSAFSKSTGFGNLVTIQHSNGFKTRYAHLSQRSVKTGDLVQKGQKIGEVGSTGRSSGPHLHYEVWFLHHKLNPLPFDKWKMEAYDKIFDQVEGVPWASLSQSVNRNVQKVEKQLSLKDVSSVVK